MSNMTFSPYSLNGHQFSGIGFDLAPGRWKISTMYGRLVKAQEATETTPAAFQRTGMGFRAGWQGDKLRGGVTTFYARDNPNSVTIPVRPDTSAPFEQPTPLANLVVGVNFGATLFNFLQFDIEYTNSVLERNRTITTKGALNAPAALLWHPNATAESYGAVKSTLNAVMKRTNTIVGVGYERVDPNYLTLGGYFFTNDFTNVTLNFSQPFWGGKINSSGSIGVQWDDLKNVKTSSQRRLVGNLNVIATPSPRLNLSASYSSFQAYTLINNSIQNITRLSPLEQIDTLNFTQITQNASVNAVYQLRTTESNTQSLMANVTLMGVANKQGDMIRRGQLSEIFNGTVSYSYGLPRQALTLTTGVNVMDSYISRNRFNSIGPTVGFNKAFLNNTLLAALTSSYLYATAETSTSEITNARLTLNYTALQRHNFTFLLASLWQSTRLTATGNFITATLGYTTRF